MRNRLSRILIVGALVLCTAGCGSSPPAPNPETPVEALTWPKPPAEPRIRYVRSFSGPHDLGIEKSFWRRVVETLTGKTEEFFIRPTGVAERAGVLYVADPGAQVLWIFDVPQKHFVKIHQIGKVPLVSPVAIAVRRDGAVFVADSYLKKIFLLNREGKLLQTIADDFERPAALAYDETTARLYVADSAAHRIVVYQGGTRVLAWGKRGYADGEFNYPTHLALDSTGTLLVTDALNFRIQAFDREGKFLWKMGRQGDSSGYFSAPKGVAADSQGHIYVVDALFDTVQIFDRDGSLLLAFGDRGIGPGQLWIPAGIFINPRNQIYVADSYNQRVQIFDLINGQ